MKEMWETPRIAVEEFAANEYVAACWGVGCDVDASNKWEKENDSNVWNNRAGRYYTWYELNTLGTSGDAHGTDHCGNSGNQVIFDYDNNGTADAMKEVGTDGLGDLDCTIWTDNTFSTTMDVGDVSIGDVIYWTTSAGNKIWHHIGKVFATVLGHPNRS